MTRRHGLATGWKRFVGCVGLAVLILGGLLVPRAHATRAPEATPEASPSGRGFLLVADTAEQRLYVYRVPGMRLTGEVHGVLLGVHCGTLTLPDGRILLSDTAAQEILALRIDEDGTPVVVNRTKARLGQQAVWASATPVPVLRCRLRACGQRGASHQSHRPADIHEHAGARRDAGRRGAPPILR